MKELEKFSVDELVSIGDENDDVDAKENGEIPLVLTPHIPQRMYKNTIYLNILLVS